MTQEKIIELIESERKALKMDVRTLCEKVGIVNYTYYHWLSELASPRLCNVLEALHALGLDLKVVRIKGEPK